MRRSAPERHLGFLAAVSLCAGCLSASPFAGTFQITDGGETVVCDAGTTTEPVSGSVVIIDTGGAFDVTIGGVSETYTAAGNDTLQTTDASPVEETDDAGFEVVVNPTEVFLEADKLTLSRDTLTESGSGRIEELVGGPNFPMCSFTRWFVATRESEEQ